MHLILPRMPATPHPDTPLRFTRRATALLLPTAFNLSAVEVLTPALAAIMARTTSPEAAIGGYAIALGIVRLINLPQLRVQQLTLVYLEDHRSRARLDRFIASFAVAAAIITALVALTPLNGWLLDRVFAVEDGIGREAVRALIALIPFAPLALMRMHLYGAALRTGHSGIVWTGSIASVACAILFAAVLLVTGLVDGALTAAVAVTLAAAIEVIYLIIATSRPLRTELPRDSGQPPPTYRELWRFFLPLLFSALLPAFMLPFLNAAMARAGEPGVSIAAFAVTMGIFALVTAATTGVQSASLALFSRGERPSWVVLYSLAVGLLTFIPVGIVAFVTPVTDLVFVQLMGTEGRLYDLSVLGLRILAILPPFLVVEQCFASVLMRMKHTRPIVYINLWRLAALIAYVLVALQVDGIVGIVLGVTAVTTNLIIETLVTLLYARHSYREIADTWARTATELR